MPLANWQGQESMLLCSAGPQPEENTCFEAIWYPGQIFEGPQGQKRFESHRSALDSVINQPDNSLKLHSICLYGSLRGFPVPNVVPSRRYIKRNRGKDTPEALAACDLAVVLRHIINGSGIPQPDGEYHFTAARPSFYESLQQPRGSHPGPKSYTNEDTAGTKLLRLNPNHNNDANMADMVDTLRQTPADWPRAQWSCGDTSVALIAPVLVHDNAQRRKIVEKWERLKVQQEAPKSKVSKRSLRSRASIRAATNPTSRVNPTATRIPLESIQRLPLSNATTSGLNRHHLDPAHSSQPIGVSQIQNSSLDGTEPSAQAVGDYNIYEQNLRAAQSGLGMFSANMRPYDQSHYNAQIISSSSFFNPLPLTHDGYYNPSVHQQTSPSTLYQNAPEHGFSASASQAVPTNHFGSSVSRQAFPHHASSRSMADVHTQNNNAEYWANWLQNGLKSDDRRNHQFHFTAEEIEMGRQMQQRSNNEYQPNPYLSFADKEIQLGILPDNGLSEFDQSW